MTSDEGTKVGTMTLRGKEYDVLLKIRSAYGGGAPSARFVLEGLTAGRYASEVSSDTYEGLYKTGMLATKARAIKIEMPVMRVTCVGRGSYSQRKERERVVEPGVVVGRHAGNGNVLVRWGDAKTAEQMLGFDDHHECYRPMVEERQAELLELLRARHEVEEKIRRFDETYKIRDLAMEVEAEIERKASEIVDP